MTINNVAVTRARKYPSLTPYHPSNLYPEYPFDSLSEESNEVYDGIRNIFCMLGLDKENCGTRKWNPLGCIIKPGMTVVLKPNFVIDRHDGGGDLFSIITHASVLRAIIDYCWIARAGRIIIADAPQYNCNFYNLIEKTGLDKVVDFYGGCVELVDLRSYWSKGKHFPSSMIPLPGDPKGSITFDLGRNSALYGIDRKIYGAFYDRSELASYHHGNVHKYEISRTVWDADVVISVPKLKTHKKVGVTLNAKNLVGTCTNKNCLVHYSLGSTKNGGDQYPPGLFNPIEKCLIKTERLMYDCLLGTRNPVLEKVHRSIYWVHNHTTRKLGLKVNERKRALDAGNWYGNDSAWRMVYDLCSIFNQGSFATFSVIDGVVAGQGNGPLLPDKKKAGILLGGKNLLLTDLIAIKVMGLNYKNLKVYKHRKGLPNRGIPNRVRVITDDTWASVPLYFEPPDYWSVNWR